MASPAQAAANRMNCQKSTGPKSPEGRARSAMNAKKHGLFSKKIARFREDCYAFEERKQKWMAGADPGNDREEFLVYLNVCQSFDLERAERAQVERMTSLVENSDNDEEVEVHRLGRRLFFDATKPIARYGTDPWINPKKQTTANREDIGPNDPAELVNKLEGSEAGCRWLRKRWQALRGQTEPGRFWFGHDRLKATRLLGRQLFDAIEDERVAEIFVASHALRRVGTSAFDDLESDMDPLELEQFEKNVRAHWVELAGITDKAKARGILMDLVERNIERLDEILEMHVQNADVTAEKTVDRLCQAESTDGKSIRGYKLKCGNAFLRTLDACKKHEKERKGEGGPRSQGTEKWCDENGHLLKHSAPGPRKARQEVVDLSWAYEMGAKMNREAQAGCGTGTSSGGAGGLGLEEEGLAPSGSASPELDSAGAVGVTERSVDVSDKDAREHDTSGACQGDGDPSGENGEKDGNKANFDENVVIAEPDDSVEVVANSGATSGLDKGGSEGAPGPGHLTASGATEQSGDRNSDIVSGREAALLPWRDEKLELSRPTAPSSRVSRQSASAGPPPQPSPARGDGFLGSSALRELKRRVSVSAREPGGGKRAQDSTREKSRRKRELHRTLEGKLKGGRAPFEEFIGEILFPNSTKMLREYLPRSP